VAAGGLTDSAMSNAEVDHMSEINDKINCPNCNLELAPTVKKCPGCGLDLTRHAPGAAADAAAPVSQPGSSPVPAPPAKGPQPSPQAAAAPPVPQMPVAPADPGVELGVIQRDVVIDGVVAFKQGERVEVEAESPDPERPEYRYVVLSKTLNKKFRLSDLDLFV